MSCLWRFPAGWQSSDPLRCVETMQLLVIEGEFNLGEHRLKEQTYACYSKGMNAGVIQSANGALVLAMLDGPIDKVNKPGHSQPSIVDIAAEELYPTPVEGPVPGIVVKVLRTDEITGGMTLYMKIPPGWAEPRAEHHDCIEESFKLSGDIWIVEDGREQILRAGDYFYRPPRIKHGPMRTEQGTSSLIRFSATVENHYGPIE